MHGFFRPQQLVVGRQGAMNPILLSRMEGKEVAPFALTYLREMTAELG